MDPGIEEYIRSNRAIYTREAREARLLRAGYDPADIDAAWDRVEKVWNAGAPVADASALPGFAMTLFVVGGIVGALGALAGLGIESSNGSHPNAVQFMITYAVLYGSIGLVLVWLTRWLARRLSIRGAWAVLAGLALLPIFGFLMFGGCLAAFGIAGAGG
jgi:hypothetical protein